MKTLSSIVLGIAFLVSAVPSFADVCSATPGNVVLNCGFEKGTYTSTANPNVPVSWISNAGFDLETGFNRVATGPAFDGTYILSIGNFDDEPVPALSQTFSDHVGATYTGSLWVDYGGAGVGDTGAFFKVVVDTTTLVNLDDTAPGAYTEYTFSFVATGSDTLTLQGNTNPSEWFVDDVTVTTSAAVPEPKSVLLLLVNALIGCAWLLLCRRASSLRSNR